MAKKKSDVKKVTEAMFLGDSRELKSYLLNKKKFFKDFLKDRKDELSENQSSKIKGYIEAIDEMIDQKYFKGRRVYSMSDMIEEIKIERTDLAEEMKRLKEEVDIAKKRADEAFKAENSYLANKYEDSYNSSGQIELRMLIDEYQMLKYQYGVLEMCRKSLWWLLGVIHRPSGFFEKVIDV